MTCRACERLLDAWNDGELTGRESLAVRAHLADCRGCRHELERIRELKTMLCARAARPEPTPPSAEAMIARARRGASPRAWEPPLWAYGAVAAAAAVVTFALLPRPGAASPSAGTAISGPAPAALTIGLDQAMSVAPDPTAGAPVISVTNDRP